MVPKKKRKIDWSDQSFTGLGLIVRTASNWKNTSSGKKGYKNGVLSPQKCCTHQLRIIEAV